MKKRRWFSRPQKDPSAPQTAEERRALLKNLEATQQELELAYLGFNQSTDPDLVEFYLFEVDALRARHSYLLRRIKQLTVQGEPAPRTEPTAQTEFG